MAAVRKSVDLGEVALDHEYEAKKLQNEVVNMDTCPEGMSQPPSDDTIKSHFDSKRKTMGILTDVAADRAKTCTKRDVCLLMRQLDMDFYKRARAGKLTDADYTMPPEVVWFSENTCRNHARGEGKRYAPVMDAKACRAHVTKSGFEGAVTKSGKVREVREVETTSSNEYPAGCSIVVNNKKKVGIKGHFQVLLNTNSNSTAEAGLVVDKGGMTSWESEVTTKVLCEQDRTLSASAASFYSPYKLKETMAVSDMAKMSTTCSFGMYAHLARTGETQSSCANILTFKTDRKYTSAEDAVKKGALEYVQKMKEKYVLMDIIANDWCPGVWKEALESKDTCLVPRVTNESAEDAQTLEKLFKDPREPKIAFKDDFCQGVSDEILATRLEGMPDAPPDFFAAVGP